MTGAVRPTFAPKLLSARDETPGARTFRFASPDSFAFGFPFPFRLPFPPSWLLEP